MINTTIGKYKINRLIGEGGMASVYEAEHEMLGTKVAVKVLNPILSANAQIKERFRNEAKLMASLDHPNITKVIDFDEQPQQLSIVMEYLNGEDLNQKIKRNGPLSEKEIRDVFSQTLSAFQYAHEKGIVHRDIKPSNIYILPNGHVKILDFGIAKLFGQGNEMTQTGTQIGTPIYMSPEQVKADKSIDYRSDIYSLGVTLFFAINGKPPYNSDSDSQFDIFTKIVYEALPEFLVQSQFNEIVLKACQKNREDRFQSCIEWLTFIKQKKSTIADVEKTKIDDSNAKDEKTILEVDSNIRQQNIENTNYSVANKNKNNKRKVVLILTGLVVLIFCIWGVFNFRNKSIDENKFDFLLSENLQDDTVSIANVVDTTQKGGTKQIQITKTEETTNNNNQVGKLDFDNLRVTTFRNGDKIFQANNFEEWMTAAENKTPAWCYVNFDSKTELKYGKLYNGYAVKDTRGLSPNGKYIPSIKDYELISTSMGIKKRNNEFPNGANKFKHLFPYAGGISYCLYCNYDKDKKQWVGPPKSYFIGENSIVRIWTKDYNGTYLYWFGLNNDIDDILFGYDKLGQGFPVRCITY